MLMFFLISAGIILADILTKIISVNLLENGSEFCVVKGILYFNYVENRGAALGMLENARWVFISVTILVVAIVLLAASFGLNGIAAQKAQEDHIWLMQTLLPDSTEFTLEPYSGEDANIRSVHKADNGFVIETVTYGYAGEIKMYVGVNLDGKVTGLVIKEMHETVGLGWNALTDWQFLSQFLNREGDAEVGTNVDAITGATVTSKAIARSVNSAVAFVTGADTGSGATSWGG